MRYWKLFVWLFLLPFAVSGFAKDTSFEGEIKPKDFIPFRAPQNTLNLPFWGSSSNGIQVVMVEKEGKRVKENDVVARFFFRMDDARSELERRFSQMQTEHKGQLLEMEKNIEGLRSKLQKSRIQAENAELDRQKGKSLSRIKRELLEYDFKLLAFEAKAMRHKLQSAEENLSRQKVLLAKLENRWKTYFAIFDSTKARFSIRSPGSGELYFPTLENSNRKVRDGDKMNSGVHFLSLVTSSRYDLEFFLPEKDLQKVKIGEMVSVETEKKKLCNAKISQISFFPQLTGFLQNSFKIPNAWDKCFVVVAEIPSGTRKLPLGTVKVKLKEK